MLNTNPPAQQSKETLQCLNLRAERQLSARSEQTAQKDASVLEEWLAHAPSLHHTELQWPKAEQHRGLALVGQWSQPSSLSDSTYQERSVTASSLGLLAIRTVSVSTLQPLAQQDLSPPVGCSSGTKNKQEL